MFRPECELCGGRMAYLPRTDWRERGADPRDVVPHLLGVCANKAFGVLFCTTCDVVRGAGGEVVAAPPRIGLAVRVGPVPR